MAKQVTRVLRETVDNALAALKEATTQPPPRPASFSMQDVVTELAPLVRDLQKRGYALDDILPIVNKSGIPIKLGALKTYLARAPKPPVAEKATGEVKFKPGSKREAPAAPTVASPSTPSPGARLRAPEPEGDVI